jgi:hypothetical protein
MENLREIDAKQSHADLVMDAAFRLFCLRVAEARVHLKGNAYANAIYKAEQERDRILAPAFVGSNGAGALS